jgi:hypothetical protein
LSKEILLTDGKGVRIRGTAAAGIAVSPGFASTSETDNSDPVFISKPVLSGEIIPFTAPAPEFNPAGFLSRRIKRTDSTATHKSTVVKILADLCCLIIGRI